MKIKPKQNALFAVHFDRLSLTIPNIDTKHHEKLILNTKCIANEIAQKFGCPVNQVMKNKDGYKHVLCIPLTDTFSFAGKNNGVPHIYLQVSPWSEKKPFVRLELNGHPLSKAQYFQIRLWLELLFKGADSSAISRKNITVTRVDIAIDVNCKLSQMVVDFKNSKRSGTYWGKDGEPETYYLNHSKQVVSICIYDRNANCKAKNLAQSDEPVTRIELRLKTNIKLDKLAEKIEGMNLLDDLYIFDREKIKASSEFPPFFIDYASDVGLKPALQKLDMHQRKAIHKLLLNYYTLQIIDDELVHRELAKEFNRLSALFTSRNNGNRKTPAKLRRSFDIDWGGPIRNQMKNRTSTTTLS